MKDAEDQEQAQHQTKPVGWSLNSSGHAVVMVGKFATVELREPRAPTIISSLTHTLGSSLVGHMTAIASCPKCTECSTKAIHFEKQRLKLRCHKCGYFWGLDDTKHPFHAAVQRVVPTPISDL